jgi:hypothetical protein
MLVRLARNPDCPKRQRLRCQGLARRSVFVDVVAVLVVPVTIMDVVLMITVLHDLAAVTVRVGAFVVGVCRLFSMTLIAMHVVKMVAVLDGFATVSDQVFVVRCLRVLHRHDEFLPGQ